MITDIVYAIQDIFMILFAPMGFLAKLELENWWLANVMNWVFVAICIASIMYWLKQLNIFNKTDDEKRDVVSHSFFK